MKRIAGSLKQMIGCLSIVCIFALLLAGCSIQKNQKSDQPEAAAAGGEVLTNSIGMKLKLIPAGSFMMGSPESEKYRVSNEVLHKVTLTKPFYLGVYEVTQEQYMKVMGTNPSQFKGPKKPAEMVSWDDAKAFCEKLSELEKREYRLPTEAEWEYACRAGTTTAFYWGDTFDEKYAWSAKNSGGKSQDVGMLKPNAWGLFDMIGNVWEWCEDWKAAYPTGEQVDPKGAASGSGRVFRGGSWNIVPLYCRSANRSYATPVGRSYGLGFRVLAVPAAVQ